jgi:azurin
MIRSTFRTTYTILLAGTLALFLAACGGGDTSDAGSNAADSGESTTQQSGEVDREITLQPQGNQIAYATTELTAQAGETVRLVFENTADSPAMVHNVLLLNTNDEEVIQRVGTASQAAGEAEGYVPDDDAIIAYTPLAQPGETVEMTFTAPEEPGEYTYLCTYPGHWAIMQGTLTVEG